MKHLLLKKALWHLILSFEIDMKHKTMKKEHIHKKKEFKKK